MKRYIVGVLVVAAIAAVGRYWEVEQRRAEAPASSDARALLDSHNENTGKVIEFMNQQGQQPPPQRGR